LHGGAQAFDISSDVDEQSDAQRLLAGWSTFVARFDLLEAKLDGLCSRCHVPFVQLEQAACAVSSPEQAVLAAAAADGPTTNAAGGTKENWPPERTGIGATAE
jgi:hypothetical protein